MILFWGVFAFINVTLTLLMLLGYPGRLLLSRDGTGNSTRDQYRAGTSTKSQVVGLSENSFDPILEQILFFNKIKIDWNWI